MMSSTFTTFDLMITNTNQPSYSYVYGVLPMIILLQLYWITPPTRWTFLIQIQTLTLMLISPTTGSHIKGMMLMLTPSFLSLIILNSWGAAPLTITLTSHLMTTLSAGAPMWTTMMLLSFNNKLKSMSAHFLPENTPSFISSFLSLVETISSYIRPITLSFRLAANISAGHVILGMMTSACAFSLLTTLSLLLLSLTVSSGYTMFELMICLVQAFVFILLTAMYSNDYLTPNKSSMVS